MVKREKFTGRETLSDLILKTKTALTAVYNEVDLLAKKPSAKYGHTSVMPDDGGSNADHDKRYFTKSQLANAGRSTVHWENIIANDGPMFDYIDFNTFAVVDQDVEGRVSWNSNEKTLDIVGAKDTILQVGKETRKRCVNKQGSTILNGQLVYVSGAQGMRPAVKLARGDVEETSRVLGMATEDIENNQEGEVTLVGVVNDINVDAGIYAEGDELWLSSTVAGAFTNVEPSAPHHCDFIGTVLKAHGVHGAIDICISRHKDLNSLSDVNGTPVDTSGQIIVWDNDNKYFDFTHNINDYALQSIHTNTLEPTGFLDRSECSIYFDTDRFYINGVSWRYYLSGVLYTIGGAKSIDIPTDVTARYYITIDNTGELSRSTTPWTFDENKVFIAIVYYNHIVGTAIVEDERHGCVMSWADHEWIHRYVGTRYGAGLTGVFDNTTMLISTGHIADEDIRLDIGDTTTCRVWYRSGTRWDFTAPQSSYYYGSPGSLYYDNGGTLTPVDANKYIAVWIFATNDIDNPIMAIVGQRQDTLIANARLYNTYESIEFGDLPFAEYKILYRVILRNDATPYEETQDLRSVSNIPSGTYVATSHGALTGLSNQDHPASAIYTDTTNFDGNLSSGESTVQLALDKLDNPYRVYGSDRATLALSFDADKDGTFTGSALFATSESIGFAGTMAIPYASIGYVTDTELLIQSTQTGRDVHLKAGNTGSIVLEPGAYNAVDGIIFGGPSYATTVRNIWSTSSNSGVIDWVTADDEFLFHDNIKLAGTEHFYSASDSARQMIFSTAPDRGSTVGRIIWNMSGGTTEIARIEAGRTIYATDLEDSSIDFYTSRFTASPRFSRDMRLHRGHLGIGRQLCASATGADYPHATLHVALSCSDSRLSGSNIVSIFQNDSSDDDEADIVCYGGKKGGGSIYFRCSGDLSASNYGRIEYDAQYQYLQIWSKAVEAIRIYGGYQQINMKMPVYLESLDDSATTPAYYLTVTGSTNRIERRTILSLATDIVGSIDHGSIVGLADDDHTQYLLADGTRALTADWDAGGYEIRALTFESDVATGTPPLTIASTTVVPNLNSDLLDGQHGSYYAPAAHGVTTGYLPYANAATTWAASPIYTDGTKIGIGDTSPTFKTSIVNSLGRGLFIGINNTVPATMGTYTLLGTHYSGTGDGHLHAISSNASYAATMVHLECYRTASTAYNFIKCTIDGDGTPSVGFNVAGDGSTSVGASSTTYTTSAGGSLTSKFLTDATFANAGGITAALKTTKNVTTNGTYTNIALDIASDVTIATGVTDSGQYTTVRAAALRAGTGDIGTLTRLASNSSSYGHHTTATGAPVTTLAQGLAIAPWHGGNGTITTGADIYIYAPLVTGATVTNDRCIYSLHDAMSQFVGHIAISADNRKLYLGAANDASILYDGTNMVFNSREVGTGDFVFSGGNVGIGTTSPGEKFHLLGDAWIQKATGGAGTEVGALYIGGYLQGSEKWYTASIRVVNTGTAPLILAPRIGFFTQNLNEHQSINQTERMTILAQYGYVGIGTTAPDKQLEINSATGACLRLTHNDSNGSATYYTDFSVSDAGNLTIAPSGGAVFMADDVALTMGNSAADPDVIIEHDTTANPDEFIIENTVTSENIRIKAAASGSIILEASGGGGGDGNVNIKFGSSGVCNIGETAIAYVQFDYAGNTYWDGGYPHLPVKNDTGDPTGVEGRIYINTHDNKIRCYADGAWRDLATW